MAGAFIGAALGFVVATIMESAVSTVFVCFAEDPKALEISHPDLSDRLVEAWETMLQVRTVGQNSEVLAVVKSDHWPFFLTRFVMLTGPHFGAGCVRPG